MVDRDRGKTGTEYDDGIRTITSEQQDCMKGTELAAGSMASTGIKQVKIICQNSNLPSYDTNKRDHNIAVTMLSEDGNEEGNRWVSLTET